MRFHVCLPYVELKDGVHAADASGAADGSDTAVKLSISRDQSVTETSSAFIVDLALTVLAHRPKHYYLTIVHYSIYFLHILSR